MSAYPYIWTGLTLYQKIFWEFFINQYPVPKVLLNNLANQNIFKDFSPPAGNRSFFKNGIHVWIKTTDTENANLMILLSFIILGHPDWRHVNIKIFDVCKKEDVKEVKARMHELVESGRLPLTKQNIKIVIHDENVSYKKIISNHSQYAGLTIMGFRKETIQHNGIKMFEGLDDLGNILFVNSYKKKTIE